MDTIKGLLQISEQISNIISACKDYDHMQAEILMLLESESEIFNPVLLLLDRIKEEKLKDEKNAKALLVKTAINTLSYTELEVTVRIFKALQSSKDDVLIAGKIADSIGVTRSVVVSALRKLESAGIIETRSLGVKGTYIKILNASLVTELSRLSN